MEIGESPRQAAQRETHEEIGALPRKSSRCSMFSVDPTSRLPIPTGTALRMSRPCSRRTSARRIPNRMARRSKRSGGSHTRISPPPVSTVSHALSWEASGSCSSRARRRAAAVVSNRTDVIDHSHCDLGAIRTRCPKAGHWVVVLP